MRPPRSRLVLLLPVAATALLAACSGPSPVGDWVYVAPDAKAASTKLHVVVDDTTIAIYSATMATEGWPDRPVATGRWHLEECRDEKSGMPYPCLDVTLATRNGPVHEKWHFVQDQLLMPNGMQAASMRSVQTTQFYALSRGDDVPAIGVAAHSNSEIIQDLTHGDADAADAAVVADSSSS